MKLHCSKCNKILTEDLRHIKNSKSKNAFESNSVVYENSEDTDEEQYEYSLKENKFKKGVFLIEKGFTEINNEDR